MGRSPSLLSRYSETSVTLTGRRAVEPWKITSSILPPRSNRADCSPSTHRTESETLDLPQPLGPTMAVTPSSKVRVTLSAKDLNPESSSLVSFIAPILSGRGLVLGGDHERGHSDLPSGLFRLFPGGVGAQHYPMRLVAPRGLEHRRRKTRGAEPLRQLLGPGGILGGAHLEVDRGAVGGVRGRGERGGIGFRRHWLVLRRMPGQRNEEIVLAVRDVAPPGEVLGAEIERHQSVALAGEQ